MQIESIESDVKYFSDFGFGESSDWAGIDSRCERYCEDIGSYDLKGAVSELEFHPLANIFPLLEGNDFEELVADIKTHGQLEPIVILGEKILDGRNRYRACLAARTTPILTPFTGDDPLAFVISANLHRRHLDESQRAMVAAKLANLRLGDNQHSEGLPIGRGSGLLNVGERTVARAREVLDHGTSELQQAVERGAVSVSAAADVASLPKEEQTQIVARGEREILEKAKAIRAEKTHARHAARIARIAQISTNNPDIPAGRCYPVIYADPPWHYELYNETTGASRIAAEHYPTMELDKICAFPISQLATPDAILYLWTTAPHLRESFQVLEAWDFEYKTGAVWTKHAIGLGHFVRGQHEHLLIATRGNFPCPLRPIVTVCNHRPPPRA